MVRKMSYISFVDVKKEYRMGEVTIKAVDGVDFVIEKGEFAIIVGPSGALDYVTGKAILKLYRTPVASTG